MTFEGQAKAEFIMYATAGGGGGGGGGRGGEGRGFFFQRLVFLYPPPPKVHTNFHNPPQAISQKMNTPPLPSQEISK